MHIHHHRRTPRSCTWLISKTSNQAAASASRRCESTPGTETGAVMQTQTPNSAVFSFQASPQYQLPKASLPFGFILAPLGVSADLGHPCYMLTRLAGKQKAAEQARLSIMQLISLNCVRYFGASAIWGCVSFQGSPFCGLFEWTLKRIIVIYPFYVWY